MKLKKGTILLSLGLLLIAAAFGLWGYNMWVDQKAGSESLSVIQELDSLRKAQAAALREGEIPGETRPKILPEYILNPEIPMPEKTIRGENYIGTLELPTLELELPVISWWSGDRFQIAPCRYTGSIYTNNLVLAAHNYPAHFGRLRDLHIGDAVIFTDMDGNVFQFEVASQEILKPTDVEGMTASEWPLTLYTCTIGGSYRVTVRCDRVN